MAASGHFGIPHHEDRDKELHRRPQRRGSHSGLGPFRRTPHKDSGPIGAPPKAPVAASLMALSALSCFCSS
eukprot:2502386-Pyramimonas_sp.AAC.1